MRADPFVLQPPLPLQLFLPLQPWSLVLQPPWPLQSFLPLQSCVDVEPSILRTFTPALATTVLLAAAAWERPGVAAAAARLEAPLIIPANAAAARNPGEEPKIIVLRFMIFSFR